MSVDDKGQLLFDFEKKKKKRLPRRIIDYHELAVWIGDREVTRAELQEKTGIKGEGIKTVIDTLSINYTLYDVKYGVYAMFSPVKK